MSFIGFLGMGEACQVLTLPFSQNYKDLFCFKLTRHYLVLGMRLEVEETVGGILGSMQQNLR